MTGKGPDPGASACRGPEDWTNRIDRMGAEMGREGLSRLGDGCRIAWRMDGPEGAPPLILSNSLGTTMDMWQPQLSELSARFQVLRYDTRGHGRSDVPAGGYSLDRLGRDLVELTEILGVSDAAFCGLSLGGMTGQWLGVHAPERFTRLILANTSSYMGPPPGWQARIETVLASGMGAIVPAVLERWFTPAYLASSGDAVRAAESWLLATSVEGYSGCCAAIRDMDLRPVVGLIDRPTLVITGDEDPATPPGQGEAIAIAIRGARHVGIKAAHLSNLEQEGAFTAAVLDFLS
jgi:3-oxoadipate enol-lactonase